MVAETASEVSVYSGHSQPVPIDNQPIERVVESIASPVQSRIDAVAAIRAAESDCERRELKSCLPGVTWRGTFSSRAKENMIAPSGYCYVDADPYAANKKILIDMEKSGDKFAPQVRAHLREGAEKARDLLMREEWCAAAWLSASGLGIGVLIPGQWEAAAALVAEVVDENGGYLVVDTAVRDCSRFNYLSHDPAARWNPNAITPEPLPEQVAVKTPPPAEGKVYLSDAADSQMALKAIELDLVGKYPSGMGLGVEGREMYYAAGRLLAACGKFCDHDPVVLNALIDNLERNGRTMTDELRQGYEKTFYTGGGFDKIRSGTFVYIVNSEAEMAGVDFRIPTAGALSALAARETVAAVAASGKLGI